MDGILIVDDEPLILETMADILEMEGIGPVLTENNPVRVEDRIAEFSPGVILLDLTMPLRSGLDVLASVRASHPHIKVIVVTGNSDVESAISCLKSGATDYLIKAVDRNRLVNAVRNAMDMLDLERENRALRRSIFTRPEGKGSQFSYIITRNAAMLDTLDYLSDISVSSRPILILGETGTGKELAARAAHESSGRSGSLVAVNVSGYDDSMFSDTIFGHVKGAFTGADVPRKGLLEEAADGTLFLDEIGDLSDASQVKLLRLLDAGEYRPVGSDKVKQSNAVILAATNSHLDSPDSGFRRDLYYRLSSHIVKLPSLDDRREDIPELIEHFVSEASAEFGKNVPHIGKDVLAFLQQRRYPGNVRELRSLMFDAVGRCRSEEIGIDFLDGSKAPIAGAADRPIWPPVLPTLKQSADLLVEEAMKRSNGNQTGAAKLLGITQPALNKRLRKN